MPSYNLTAALDRARSYRERAIAAESVAIDAAFVAVFGVLPTYTDICRYERGETCLATLPETRRADAALHALWAVQRAINAQIA